MLQKIRSRIYDILVDDKEHGRIDRAIALFLVLLIALNVVAVVLESVAWIESIYGDFFRVFELFSLTVFSIEYLLRLWVAPLAPRFEGGASGRIKYALTPMALIDLAAILPGIIPIFFVTDLRIVRVFRLFRLFRLFKMTRYVDSLNSLGRVYMRKKAELAVATIIMLILLFFSATLMHVVEHEAQPEKFPDIPSALWWGIATLTTVGYGDVYPITPLGKILGGVTAFLGIGLFALPAGILASGFGDAIGTNRASAGRGICPHCGRSLDDPAESPGENSEAVKGN